MTTPTPLAQLVPFGPPTKMAEGEFVPMAVTIATERLHVSIPLGAFTQRNGKAHFVPTVDVVGLVAVALGIGVGAMTVRAAAPVLRALATRIAR